MTKSEGYRTRSLTFAGAKLALVLGALLPLRSVAQMPPEEPPEAGTRTTLFGVEGRGSTFVYVFDRSASMSEPENKPLKTAKEELAASLNELTRVQQFSVIFYNQRPRLFQPRGRGLVYATDENKRLAGEFFDRLKADGGTNHADALEAALRIRPDVIFLLTDGDAKDDLTEDELKRLQRRNRGSVIHVIQFSSSDTPDESRLMSLAHNSGGQHVYVDYAKFTR
jgi:hypothetical protein